MRVTQNLRMDLTYCGCTPVVNAVQGEANTRVLSISLFNNGEAWEIPEGTTAAVAFKKVDGTKGLYDRLPDDSPAAVLSGSTVEVTMAPQMLTCPGAVSAIVMFYDDNMNSLATFPFRVMVERNPASGEEISNDYYRVTNLEQLNALLDDFEQEIDTLLGDFEQQIGTRLDNFEQETGTRLDDFEQETDTRLDNFEQEIGTALSMAVSSTAPSIVLAADGDLITVTDSADRPLRGLTIYGKTTQAGTPTPEAPVDLVSVGDSGAISITVPGANLCDPHLFSYENFYTVGQDGWLTIKNPHLDTTMNGRVYPAFTLTASKGTYTVSVQLEQDSSQESAFYYVSKNGAMYENESFTSRTITLTDAESIKVMFVVWGSTTVKARVMINAGGAALPWEPYQPQSLTVSTPNGLPGIPVSSGGNYTDADGQQWICDEVDFARGVYVQRIYKFKQVTPEHSYLVNYWESSAHVQMNYNLDVKAGTTERCLSPWLPCNGNVTSAAAQGCYTSGGNTLVVGLSKSFLHGYGAVAGDSASYKTAYIAWANELEAAGTPLEFYYVRKTPIETALSAEEIAAFKELHSNKPNTIAYNDSGAHMALEYNADTKLYIDNKFNELATAILNNA